MLDRYIQQVILYVCTCTYTEKGGSICSMTGVHKVYAYVFTTLTVSNTIAGLSIVKNDIASPGTIKPFLLVKKTWSIFL